MIYIMRLAKVMLYNAIYYDHIPFIVHLNGDNIARLTNGTNDIVHRTRSRNISDHESNKCNHYTCKSLAEIELPAEALGPFPICSRVSSIQDTSLQDCVNENKIFVFFNGIIFLHSKM